MELLGGANLEVAVEVGGTLPAGRVIHIASQIASALGQRLLWNSAFS